MSEPAYGVIDKKLWRKYRGAKQAQYLQWLSNQQLQSSFGEVKVRMSKNNANKSYKNFNYLLNKRKMISFRVIK